MCVLGGDCLDMWGAVQVLLPDFQAMPPNACPLAAPLTALAPCRGAEDLDHRPFQFPAQCQLSDRVEGLGVGVGGRAAMWSSGQSASF